MNRAVQADIWQFVRPANRSHNRQLSSEPVRYASLRGNIFVNLHKITNLCRFCNCPASYFLGI